MRQAYDTDITDEQWEILEPLLPPAKQGGRPRSVDMRDIINALFYILSAGCAWRLLPHDLPPWQTVYYYFRQWNQDQTWQMINDHLRQSIRLTESREASPSAACLDSQSVKTGGLLEEDIGFDGGKNIKGRKRHQLVDTLGLLILVVVTAANVTDYDGARAVLTQLHNKRQRFPRLCRIWVDGGYRGKDFMEWVMDSYRWVLEVIKRSDEAKGFVLLPRRWVVERTFGWMMWNRRLSKEYERLTKTSESFIYIASIKLMLNRFA
ncbi:MAG: IS5 family transposase [Chloroflexota bacterium]